MIPNAVLSFQSFDKSGNKAFTGIFQEGSIHKWSHDSIENRGLQDPSLVRRLSGFGVASGFQLFI